MNELVTITSQIEKCEKKDISKQVMSVCRAITPQFYKSMSVDDVKAERLSIELLTADIDNEVLAEMCKRAVLNYPKARSNNDRTYFDINYILTFYKSAFNFIHCDNIKLSKKAQKIQEYFDPVKTILYQKWVDNGKEYQIAWIDERDIPENTHRYSPKDYQMMFTSLDDVDF